MNSRTPIEALAAISLALFGCDDSMESGDPAAGEAGKADDATSTESLDGNLPFVSEIVFGSLTNPKSTALELYNPHHETLAISECALEVLNDGAANDVTRVALPEDATLRSGRTLLVCSEAFDQDFRESLGLDGDETICDVTTGELAFDGNDEVALVCGDRVLDTAGLPEGDALAPGHDAWVGDTALVRSCSVASGNKGEPDGRRGAEESWDANAWEQLGDTLGIHCEDTGVGIFIGRPPHTGNNVVPDANTLLITELMDGVVVQDGERAVKAIEIQNLSREPADLSRCMLNYYQSGDVEPFLTHDLGELLERDFHDTKLERRDYFTICHRDIQPLELADECTVQVDQIPYNGNDAVELHCQSEAGQTTVRDVFGVIGQRVDDDTGWFGRTELTTKDRTVVRQCWANTAHGAFEPTEWAVARFANIGDQLAEDLGNRACFNRPGA